jgi:hypothetical protein
VWDVEALKAEHPLSTPGKIVGGGAAHAADTEHDHIVDITHAGTFHFDRRSAPVRDRSGREAFSSQGDVSR